MDAAALPPFWVLILIAFGSASLLVTGLVWAFVDKKRPLMKAGLIAGADIVLLVALLVLGATGQEKVFEAWWSQTTPTAEAQHQPFLIEQASDESPEPRTELVAFSHGEPSSPQPAVSVDSYKLLLIAVIFAVMFVMVVYATGQSTKPDALVRYGGPAAVLVIGGFVFAMQVSKERRFATEAAAARNRAMADATIAETQATIDAFDKLTEPRIPLDEDLDQEEEERPETDDADKNEAGQQLSLQQLIARNNYAEFSDKRQGGRVEVSNGYRAESYPIERDIPAWFEDPPPARELDADYRYVLISGSKASDGGCLRYQKQHVLKVMCDYVRLRSEGELNVKPSQLAWSPAELFGRFVRECRFVHNQGRRGYSVYTLVAISNEDGGDELVEATRAKVRGPEWVTAPPKITEDRFRQVLVSGPYATLDTCRRDTDVKLQAVVQEYARDWNLILGEGSSAGESPNRLPVGPLRSRLARDEFIETVDTTVGEMLSTHTLVEIRPSDREWIQRLLAETQTLDRQAGLRRVAMIAGGVLALLAVALGLLKLDEATRGYYTELLLIGVPAAVFCLLVVTMLWLA